MPKKTKPKHHTVWSASQAFELDLWPGDTFFVCSTGIKYRFTGLNIAVPVGL